MVQITYSSSSSSSSSCSNFSSSNDGPPKLIKFSRPSYTDSLHSIRKPTRKPITKHFIAPLPPTPHKVYSVKPSEFKQAVHMLTSSPEFQSPSVRRLKDIAPPPLNLPTLPSPSSAGGETANKFISNPHVMDYFESLSPPGLNLAPALRSYDEFEVAVMSPLGLNLSPSSLSWCCSVLLSPTNLSGFNQSPIL